MHRGRAAAESPRIYLDRVERRVAGFFALAGFLALFLALFGAAFFGVAFLTVAGFLALFLALAAGFLAGVFLAGFLALRVLTGATMAAAAALARRGRFDGVGVGLETVFFLAGFDFLDFFVSLTAMVAAATAPPTTRAVGFSVYSPDRVSRMASIVGLSCWEKRRDAVRAQ